MTKHETRPRLFHFNPEIDPDKISDCFVELYKLARSHFCYKVSTSPYVDSIWEASMRQRWSPDENNPIDYEDRFTEIVRNVWREIRPATQQARRFGSKDPSLFSVHQDLMHTFGPDMEDTMPERVVLYNLELWITESLSWFWEHRLDGEKMAIFNVTNQSVELKGVVPKEMLSEFSEAPHVNHFSY